MGKIKQKSVRRAAEELLKKGIEFTTNFNKNKKILQGTLPSKKIRNQLAGLLVRMKRQEESEQR